MILPRSPTSPAFRFAGAMAIAAMVAALWLPSSATASPQAGPASSQAPADLVAAPLDRFIEAFNRWDIHYPQDAFTDDCVVMDIFPPFLWQGAGAPRRWWTVLSGSDASSHERKAALHQMLRRGAIDDLIVADERAQFTVPATLTFVRGGQGHTIHGRWIITERRTPRGWRISAHAWATLDQD